MCSLSTSPTKRDTLASCPSSSLQHSPHLLRKNLSPPPLKIHVETLDALVIRWKLDIALVLFAQSNHLIPPQFSQEKTEFEYHILARARTELEGFPFTANIVRGNKDDSEINLRMFLEFFQN